jgi:hypothetical protein
MVQHHHHHGPSAVLKHTLNCVLLLPTAQHAALRDRNKLQWKGKCNVDVVVVGGKFRDLNVVTICSIWWSWHRSATLSHRCSFELGAAFCGIC